MTTTPSFNETETVQEAMRLRADGVAIIGVGIGESVSRSELDGVVSYPVDRNAFYVDDYARLSSYVSDVVNSQCNGAYCLHHPPLLHCTTCCFQPLMNSGCILYTKYNKLTSVSFYKKQLH